MVDVFKLKDLSPQKKCKRGHTSKKYNKECEFCIDIFGENYEQ